MNCEREMVKSHFTMLKNILQEGKRATLTWLLSVDIAGVGGIREFVNNMDGPAFLERELVGLSVDGYW